MTHDAGNLGEFLKRAALTLLVAALLFLAWRVANVLLLVFFGVLLAVLLTTFTHFISRHTPLNQRWSLGLVIVVVLALLGGAGWLIGPRLSQQAGSLGTELPRAMESFEQRLSGSEWGSWLLQRAPILEMPAGSSTTPGGDAAAPQAGDRQAAGETAADGSGPGAPAAGAAAGQGAGGTGGSSGNFVSTLFSVLTTIAGIFGDALLVLFIGLFIAANPRMYRDGIAMLFPRHRRDRVQEALTELGRTIQGWLLVQLISMTVVGVLVGLGLSLLGMRFALALALLAFLLEFIPYIGPWLAFAPAALVALSMGGSMIVWVALLYLAVNIIEGDILLPILQQRTVDVPAALTLAGIFVFGALFGFMGILVAGPLVAVLYVLVKLVYVEWTLHADVRTPAEKGISP